jgi:hypothetical protein
LTVALTAAELPRSRAIVSSLLVYAAGEGESASHRVVNAGKQLDVVALDLSTEPSNVLSDVAVIAQRIPSSALRVSERAA